MSTPIPADTTRRTREEINRKTEGIIFPFGDELTTPIRYDGSGPDAACLGMWTATNTWISLAAIVTVSVGHCNPRVTLAYQGARSIVCITYRPASPTEPHG